jgi:hypothetical protein
MHVGSGDAVKTGTSILAVIHRVIGNSPVIYLKFPLPSSIANESRMYALANYRQADYRSQTVYRRQSMDSLGYPPAAG